jgi:predicted transcriptional regulator
MDDLKKLGFTDKEAQVYLMLLRIGPSPVSALANRLGLKRVTVYSVLDSLCARGLVTFDQCGNCRRYIPHDPECLLDDLEKEGAELKFRMSLAKSCVSKLHESLFYDSARECVQQPKIYFFTGSAVIKKALQERVDEKSALFFLALNFGDRLSADFMKDFLCSSFLRCCSKVYICASETFKGVNAACPNMSVDFVQAGKSTFKANVLLQGDDVFFLFSKKRELRMMHINNSAYASFSRNVLFAPFFKGLLVDELIS